MHRIDGPTAAPGGFWTEGDPVGGVPATTVSDDFMNDTQENICKVIEDAGITLVKGDYTQLVAAIRAINSSTGAVAGVASNLKLSATGANATVTITADALVVKSATTFHTLSTLSLSINSASVGANGLDTGVLAISTWYSVWAIFNPTTSTRAGLLSLSATAPTLPAGYTEKARIGWVRTDATANKFPFGFVQYGSDVQLLVAAGTNLTALPVIASGVLGNPSGGVYVMASVSAFVPSTAGIIDTYSYTYLAGAQYGVANTGGYGSPGSGANPPPVAYVAPTVSANVDFVKAPYRFALSGTNLFVCSNVADFNLKVLGWRDNL